MNVRTPTQYKPTESNVNINLSKSKAEAKILVHPKMETVCVLNNTEESSQPNFSGESKLHPSPPPICAVSSFDLLWSQWQNFYYIFVEQN